MEWAVRFVGVVRMDVAGQRRSREVETLSAHVAVAVFTLMYGLCEVEYLMYPVRITQN